MEKKRNVQLTCFEKYRAEGMFICQPACFYSCMRTYIFTAMKVTTNGDNVFFWGSCCIPGTIPSTLYTSNSFNLQTTLFSSVQFSRSVVSESLRPHESQHARPPCPSPTPGVHSNSCPWSRWCHPAISFSVFLPTIPPSIRVFSNESTLRMRWPKY